MIFLVLDMEGIMAAKIDCMTCRKRPRKKQSNK